jgi:hypothetical protein
MDHETYAEASPPEARAEAPAEPQPPPPEPVKRLPLTPELLAYFDLSISQLRTELDALRAMLQEQSSTTDEQKARMVTLNMALNGAPREEAERYLQQHFALPDATAILDDAYGPGA